MDYGPSAGHWGRANTSGYVSELAGHLVVRTPPNSFCAISLLASEKNCRFWWIGQRTPSRHCSSAISPRPRTPTTPAERASIQRFPRSSTSACRLVGDYCLYTQRYLPFRSIRGACQALVGAIGVMRQVESHLVLLDTACCLPGIHRPFTAG